MAELSTIARPYAEAAFKTALELQSLPSWSDALARMAAVLERPEAAELIGNPQLSAAQVADIVVQASGQITQAQHNFLALLIENGRLDAVPAIAHQFSDLRHRHEGVLEAHITSAYPLSEEQLAQVRQTLEIKHRKAIDVSVSVDPALIGGVSIRVGDEVTDASVRGKLARLAATLTN